MTAEEARQAPLQPNDWCAMFNRALDVFNGDELPLNDLQVAHEGIRIFVLQPSNYGVDMTSQFTKVAVGALYELHKSCRKQLREL